MFKFVGIAILLMTSSFATAQGTYTAVISCGMQGSNLNVLACFTDTDLKITKNNSSRIYKVYELQDLGQRYKDGLHIELPESFQVIAQNSQDYLVLRVKILDKKNEVVFDDQVGKWGVINVGN